MNDYEEYPINILVERRYVICYVLYTCIAIFKIAVYVCLLSFTNDHVRDVYNYIDLICSIHSILNIIWMAIYIKYLIITITKLYTVIDDHSIFLYDDAMCNNMKIFYIFTIYVLFSTHRQFIWYAPHDMIYYKLYSLIFLLDIITIILCVQTFFINLFLIKKLDKCCCKQPVIIYNYEYSNNKISNLDDDQCSICLGMYPDENELTDNEWISLSCNHAYHKQCIEIWLNKNNICPYCRRYVPFIVNYGAV